MEFAVRKILTFGLTYTGYYLQGVTMATEYARTQYRVTGHNEPGLAGKVTHILEVVNNNAGPAAAMGGNQPTIETDKNKMLPVGTIIDTVSTWVVSAPVLP